MSFDSDLIGDLTTHVSGALDGTEEFGALSKKRAQRGGRLNLRVTIAQILAYILANGGGAGGISVSTAPPGSPTSGLLAVADGVTWDPLGAKQGVPYLVIYDGTGWSPIRRGDHSGYRANWWYSLPNYSVVTGANPGVNTLRLIPVIFPSRFTMSDVGIRIATLSAGGHVTVGAYASNPTTKMPTGTALFSKEFVTDATGALTASLSSNVQFAPGTEYWFATLMDNATAVLNSANPIAGFVGSMIGSSTQAGLTAASAQLNAAWAVSGATYASGLPDVTAATFGEGGSTVNAAFLDFKTASIP